MIIFTVENAKKNLESLMNSDIEKSLSPMLVFMRSSNEIVLKGMPPTTVDYDYVNRLKVTNSKIKNAAVSFENTGDYVAGLTFLLKLSELDCVLQLENTVSLIELQGAKAGFNMNFINKTRDTYGDEFFNVLYDYRTNLICLIANLSDLASMMKIELEKETAEKKASIVEFQDKNIDSTLDAITLTWGSLANRIAIS